MTHFTPWSSLAGGLLIGVASLIMIVWLGKIAGISGILAQTWQGAAKDRPWRLAFIAGLLSAPWLYQLYSTLPSSTIQASEPLLVIAGLLVGIGTRLGSGCTSGHGVCGLSRLSLRSLAATLTFMLVAMLTVWLMPV